MEMVASQTGQPTNYQYWKNAGQALTWIEGRLDSGIDIKDFDKAVEIVTGKLPDQPTT